MIGSAYAMLTTFGNVALVCASSIGNLLSQVWDVSNDAMRTNDVRGVHSISTYARSVFVFAILLSIYLLDKSIIVVTSY